MINEKKKEKGKGNEKKREKKELFWGLLISHDSLPKQNKKKKIILK